MKHFSIQQIPAILAIASAIMLISCTRIVYIPVENVIEIPSYPDLEGLQKDTLTLNFAQASFYGAYSETVDRWYITLTTDEGTEYSQETDSYTGKGKMITLCLHTGITAGGEEDMKVMAGNYTCPDTYSDLGIGQFEMGYQKAFQHPYYGTLYSNHGCYLAELSKDSYNPVMCMDGEFSVKTNGSTWTIEGMLLDVAYTKHYFRFQGPMTLGPEYQFPGAPDSVLKKDISLDRKSLVNLEIRDRGDQYRYDSKPRFRNYRVFLTGKNVVVGKTESIYDQINLSGEGPVVLLDLFVNPDSNGKIPAGKYELLPRLENMGLDGSLIWPFKFLEGYSHYYFGSALQGCWYFNLGPDGLWEGDYARITGGTLEVSYSKTSEEPIFTASFLDCCTPANTITLNW